MAGMTKKILKTIEKDFMKPNNLANGGGLSSILVPRKLNLKGGAALMGIAAVGVTTSEGLKGNSKAKTGVISYGESMARMSDTFNTGVTSALQRASKGDYETYSEMAKDVVQSPTLESQLDDFGANPDMIAALYNMGGN